MAGHPSGLSVTQAKRPIILLRKEVGSSDKVSHLAELWHDRGFCHHCVAGEFKTHVLGGLYGIYLILLRHLLTIRRHIVLHLIRLCEWNSDGTK